MRKLIKDSEDNVFELNSLNGSIPDGYTEVPSEELDAEELALARKKKVESVRSQRDAMMLVHDKVYLIALKDATDTTTILADRQLLLDLPEDAQTAIDALATKEDVEAYDAFADSVEKWTKEGEADVFVDPVDETWTHVPSVPLLSRSYE